MSSRELPRGIVDGRVWKDAYLVFSRQECGTEMIGTILLAWNLTVMTF